jgi:osmotically-inducible protein OsmY
MRPRCALCFALTALAVAGCQGERARAELRDEKSVNKPKEQTYSHDSNFDPDIIVDQELSEEQAVSSAVRGRVLADEKLSPLAKNVSIVTRGGTVKLIGFARDAIEKNRLTAIAGGVPGVNRVDNLVVVASSAPVP